jgi:hypothetical protein
MSKTKLPRAESLIWIAFLGCIALWAISKCSNRRSELVRQVREIGDDDETEERPVRHDTVSVPAATIQKPAAQTPSPEPTIQNPVPPAAKLKPSELTIKPPTPGNSKPSASASAPKTPTSETAAKSGTTLYTTIDGLKVRKEPGLKGETIEQLKLYEPVTFLNQKTEWKQEISLGYEKVTDHWVKIRTASGKTGWVFGAGVHFYKMKREGVMPESKASDPGLKKKN